MPTVRFPAVMKYYVNNQAEFFVPAATVKEVVDQVIEQYPSIKFHLVTRKATCENTLMFSSTAYTFAT